MREQLPEATLLRIMALPEPRTGDEATATIPPMPTRLPTRPCLAKTGVLIAALALTTVLFSFWIADAQAAEALPWLQILIGLAVCILSLLGALLARRHRGGSHG
jgi:hypothetical protein